MNFWNYDTNQIIKGFGTNLTFGLSSIEAEKRREKYGNNKIEEGKKKNLFLLFLAQFTNIMIIVLIIAAIISFIININEQDSYTDAIAILVIVILNAVIGTQQEYKAEKALENLQDMSENTAKVIRDGILTNIKSSELTLGDIVILETGDFVPADLRIIENFNIEVDESHLTGESESVIKDSNTIYDKELALGDRKNMLFTSSLVTSGRAKAVVIRIGMSTEVGKIASMLKDTKKPKTPLEEKMNSLSKVLVIGALFACLVIFVIGLFYGKSWTTMLMMSVSLAVSAIPEGLPAITTVVLAVGVQRLVKKNAIIKKLPAVESLGSVSVICSDKTGTLTQNRMTVKKIFVNGKIKNLDELEHSESLTKLITGFMLCNDSKISKEGLTGEPTETALVRMGYELGFDSNLFFWYKRIAELPFDSERKRMTTVHKIEDKYIVYVKGGLDEILSISSAYEVNNTIHTDEYKFMGYRGEVLSTNDHLASESLRVLAIGYKILDREPMLEDYENFEKDLIFLGLVGMMDPPREEAKDSIIACKDAGIIPIMITGDHQKTAEAIARDLNILEEDSSVLTGLELDSMSDEEFQEKLKEYRVYARVSPANKLRIIEAWQNEGKYVAMTGDGVNDAPALKKADIGCAMGIQGTDVAKEAADIVLTDDNFATIVEATKEGRRIFDNVLKVIHYLLSSNVGEILIIFLSILFMPQIAKWFNIVSGDLIPLLPIQILFINLVTDALPAMALSVDPASKDIMKVKAEKRKGLENRGFRYRIIYQSVVIGLLSFAAFLIGLTNEGSDAERIAIAQTMTFTVLSFAELIHVFNVRDSKKSIFKSDAFKNKFLILATIFNSILMFLTLSVSQIRDILKLTVIPRHNIPIMIVLIFLPTIIIEIMKYLDLNELKEERDDLD